MHRETQKYAVVDVGSVAVVGGVVVGVFALVFLLLFVVLILTERRVQNLCI